MGNSYRCLIQCGFLFISSPEQAALMSADMGEFNVEGVMNAVMSVNWLEIGIYFLLFSLEVMSSMLPYLRCLPLPWTVKKILLSL